MKIVLLLVIFAVFANAGLIPMKKSVGRQVLEADNLMTLYFRGTCAQFDTIASTISVTRLDTPTRYCLPINADLTNIDDATVTFVCEDEGKYSRVRITEAYDQTITPYPNESERLPFILAINSFAPFRADSAFYYRRPSCSFVTDLCSGATPTLHVHQCESNQVDLSDADYHNDQWVLNRDTVYVTTNNQTFGQCYGEAGVATDCCVYVTPTSLCNTTTDSSLFEFTRQRPQQQQQQYQAPAQTYTAPQEPAQPYVAPVTPAYQAPQQSGPVQHAPAHQDDEDDDAYEYSH